MALVFLGFLRRRGRVNLDNRLVYLISIAAVVVLLAFAAWRVSQSNRAAEVARTALAARRIELTTQLHRWEAELAVAKQRSAERAITPVAEPLVTMGPPAPGARAASSFLEWMEDPKVQVLFYASERAQLTQTYGPFFRAHALSPAQIEKLSDLIIRSRQQTFDLSEINRTKGLAFSDPAMVAQRKQGEEEVQAGMREVLGDSGYAELKDYARALEVHTFVGKISGVAATEGIPINPEQADALVRVLANACPMYSLGGPANFNRIDWKAAEAQAQGVLSSEQMKLLQTDKPGIGRSPRRAELDNAVHRAMNEMRAVPRPPGG